MNEQPRKQAENLEPRNETLKFVNDWLCNSRRRLTIGASWDYNFVHDAAAMIEDFDGRPSSKVEQAPNQEWKDYTESIEHKLMEAEERADLNFCSAEKWHKEFLELQSALTRADERVKDLEAINISLTSSVLAIIPYKDVDYQEEFLTWGKSFLDKHRMMEAALKIAEEELGDIAMSNNDYCKGIADSALKRMAALNPQKKENES